MRKFLSLIFIVCAALSQAQLKQFKGMNMRSIGPAVTSGRVTSIDVDMQRGVMYVGSASGGLWKSDSWGTKWQPIFDHEAVTGIGAVQVSSVHPDEIWVGTGEGNPRNSQTSGRGIYRSQDGGKSWKCMGLEETKAIHRICLDKKDNVYVGAMGSAWGPNPDRGVFYYNQTQKNWKKILYVNDSVGCADLVMDPSNDQKMLAAMWQYQRQPWTFQSGGKGSGLYITWNGGEDWKLLGEKDGLPKGNLGRIGIAIAPSDSRIVYAMIESKNTALYRSVDGGLSWSMVTDKGVNDRPFYYSEFYVDPHNANHLIYLHSVVTESIDGGKTWTTLLPYSGVHPDHHAFWWNPNNSNEMWEGNDGGLNVSRDGGKNWEFIPNLPLGQFYHINYDLSIPYNVYGGLQDNGTWKGPSYVWHSDGILDSDWQELYFGDGFDAVPDESDEDWVYVLSQGGSLARVNAVTGQEQFIQPTHPDGIPLRFHWNTAISNQPNAEPAIYIGSQFVHYSKNHGQTWEIISPDLTTNDPKKQEAHKSGGLTTDATSAENHCTILCITPNSNNQQEIWVGTDDGQVQVTRDHGKSWNNITADIKGMSKNAWISQIVISDKNSNEVWVVANNYRQNDWKPYLFHTTDGGKHWKNAVEKSGMTGHCLSVAQDNQQPDLVFCGTEHGLYVSMDHGNSWEKWTHNYPSVPTQDLRIHPTEGDLMIATFGRGLYILDDINPIRDVIFNRNNNVKSKLQVYRPQTAYLASYRRHLGQRFPGDRYFSGENRDYGVQVFCHADLIPVAEGKEKEKMKIAILSGNDTIRNFEQEPDSFLTVIHWHFDSNGFQFPTKSKREPSKVPPGGGWKVAPGRYEMHIAYGEAKVHTDIWVEEDPRIPFEPVTYTMQQGMYLDWKKMMKDLDQEVEKVKDAQALMQWVNESCKYLPDSIQKSLKVRTDSLNKSFNVQMEKIFMKDGLSGIQDDSRVLSGRWWTPYSLLSTESERPGENAQNALKVLQRDIQTWKDANAVIWDTNWKAFVQLADMHVALPKKWKP
ncbi:MAG: hypothetical protein RL062_827 [Bacteroidota bacterium]|jgi:photosystem II stability/assembly factor-like uncharacterized protein